VAVRLSRVIAPREREFFDLFEEAGGNIQRAASLLEEMLRDYPDRSDLARDILICEQEGDRITHDIIQRLNQTFVTPIDREDILALASALDDVVDFTEEVADYLGLYQIEAPMEQAQQLARVLHQASRQIAEALPRLRGFKGISHYTVEINRLENDGDRITREAVASLFDDGIDPMVVIRWKDIFERLESAIDATEHVANIIEGIALKNS
jgi:predicted phosphate transport protein (TIGR00153 family)